MDNVFEDNRLLLSRRSKRISYGRSYFLALSFYCFHLLLPYFSELQPETSSIATNNDYSIAIMLKIANLKILCHIRKTEPSFDRVPGGNHHTRIHTYIPGGQQTSS